MSCRPLLLSFLVAGCASNLDMFVIVDDGGAPCCTQSSDAPIGTDSDGTAHPTDAPCACPDGGPPDLLRPSTCPLPTLLVAMDNYSGSGSTRGRVMRLSLGGGAPSLCTDLSGGKTLPNQLWSVAYTPPGNVVVGADSQLITVDPSTDQIVWNYQYACCNSGGRPADLISVVDGTGKAYLGVGLDNSNDSSIATVDMFLLDGRGAGGTKPAHSWHLNDSNSPLLLGLSVTSISANPADPTHLLVLNEFDYAAADVPIPFDEMPVMKTVYVKSYPPGGGLKSIYGIKHASGTRSVAWWQHDFNGTSGDAAFYVSDTGSGPMLHGPLRCADARCKQPNEFEHVVPDPTDETRAFAICTDAGGDTLRHVVRMSLAGCDVLIDGTKLSASYRPSAMGIAQ